jgi:hypothetical protein
MRTKIVNLLLRISPKIVQLDSREEKASGPELRVHMYLRCAELRFIARRRWAVRGVCPLRNLGHISRGNRFRNCLTAVPALLVLGMYSAICCA